MIYPQPQRVRLADDNGLITREWLRYLESLQASIPAATDLTGIQAQIVALQASVAALTATVAAVTGVSSIQVVINVPADSFSVTQTVPFPGLEPTQSVVATLGGFLDTEENDPELLDVLALSVTPASDSATIEMAFATPTSGAIRLNLVAF
jgi:hypothetical protein